MTASEAPNDPLLLFVKPNAISVANKKALKRAGVLVIETDQPNEIKFVRAGMQVTGFELLAKAIKAMRHSSIATNAFGDSLIKILEESL